MSGEEWISSFPRPPPVVATAPHNHNSVPGGVVVNNWLCEFDAALPSWLPALAVFLSRHPSHTHPIEARTLIGMCHRRNSPRAASELCRHTLTVNERYAFVFEYSLRYDTWQNALVLVPRTPSPPLSMLRFLEVRGHDVCRSVQWRAALAVYSACPCPPHSFVKKLCGMVPWNVAMSVCATMPKSTMDVVAPSVLRALRGSNNTPWTAAIGLYSQCVSRGVLLAMTTSEHNGLVSAASHGGLVPALWRDFASRRIDVTSPILITAAAFALKGHGWEAMSRVYSITMAHTPADPDGIRHVVDSTVSVCAEAHLWALAAIAFAEGRSRLQGPLLPTTYRHLYAELRPTLRWRDALCVYAAHKSDGANVSADDVWPLLATLVEVRRSTEALEVLTAHASHFASANMASRVLFLMAKRMAWGDAVTALSVLTQTSRVTDPYDAFWIVAKACARHQQWGAVLTCLRHCPANIESRLLYAAMPVQDSMQYKRVSDVLRKLRGEDGLRGRPTSSSPRRAVRYEDVFEYAHGALLRLALKN